MPTLTADKNRAFEVADIEEYPVIAADIIYKGAAVGENGAGFARPLVAGDKFIGFALEQVDNSTGVAGARNVKVRRNGTIELPVAGLAITSNNQRFIYASDDDTFTTTPTGNSMIGTVRRWVSTGVALVEYSASRRNFNGITPLTSGGGTADNTLQLVGATNGSDVSAAINNNFADLVTKVNQILTALV